MKKMILVLSMVLASPAFAAGHVVAQVNQINATIQSVSLTGDGLLSVELRDGRELTQRLSNDSSGHLAYLAQSLAAAPLTTERHVVVCMMMINPMFMPSLSVAGADDAMRVVLPTNNCATPVAIFPTDRQAYASAVALKTTLTTLANELAN